jgi:hypothetical protein
LALSESPTIAKLAEKLISILRAAGSTEESVSATSKSDLAAQVQQAASQHAVDIDESVLAEVTKTIQSNELSKTGRMIH